MEKKEKREYVWFVEPLGGNRDTNMVISQELPEENFGREKCEDGKKQTKPWFKFQNLQ